MKKISLVAAALCAGLIVPMAARAQNAVGIDGRLPQASVPEEPPKKVAKKPGKKKQQSDDFRAKVPGEPKPKKRQAT